jgi:hypothetical protein
MNTKHHLFLLTFILILSGILFGGNYKNFTVSVYARAYEVRGMKDLNKLDSIWTFITQQVKIDKIYLETHRDDVTVDEQTIESVKKYFLNLGIKVAGGITYTIDESDHFKTFCYSDPEQRKKAKEIAELTAKHFDEFILDDFFFTSCKCDLCIKAKGNLSWTDFRLKLMTEAAKDLIINPAKKINPNVKVVIKYPNWYEHFQGLGFNLETEPKLFDGIYTGTETRDPEFSNQHLQQYESYLIFRYFENIKPGGNGGGWVDPFASFYMDRYAEQLWLTLFAKASEVTLFDFRSIQRPFINTDRAVWQGNKTSFDFDEMIKTIQLPNGKIVEPKSISRAAGYTFETVDKFLDKLGNPKGVKSYKPYNSLGEDFLQNFLGMIGVPMDLVPEFPADSKMILLTESAKFDPNIVSKIKGQLTAGKNIMITSGLLRALQGKGIEDIAEINYTESKAIIDTVVVGRGYSFKTKKGILIPQIQYLTNDSWEDISSRSSGLGWPILLQTKYSNGFLFVLVIPENFADLYNLPAEALNRLRQVLTQDLNIRIEGPSQISLFIYDNNTFIVNSFLPRDENIKIIINKNISEIQNILSGEKLTGKKEKNPVVWGRINEEVSTFELKIKPHSYLVFRFTE